MSETSFIDQLDSPLRDAIKAGDIATVKRLILEAAERYRDQTGETEAQTGRKLEGLMFSMSLMTLGTVLELVQLRLARFNNLKETSERAAEAGEIERDLVAAATRINELRCYVATAAQVEAQDGRGAAE